MRDEFATNSLPSTGSIESPVLSRFGIRRFGILTRSLFVSIALTLMTLSLLGAACSLGIWPNPIRGIEKERVALLDMIAISATGAISRGEDAAIERMSHSLLKSGSGVRSIAVRRDLKGTVYESAGHTARWAGAPAEGSTLTHARLPIFCGEKHWGQIELTFDDPNLTQVAGVPMSLQLRGMLGISLVAGLVYWAAATIVLYRLQPGTKGLGRVQSVFDAITAGVVLLDDAQRVVIANSEFWMLTGLNPDEMRGRTLDCLRWETEFPEITDIPLPWQETLQDGLTRTRCRIVLRLSDGTLRCLSVSAAAVPGPRGKPMGVLFTLDDISQMEAQLAENSALMVQLAQVTEGLHRKNEELQMLATTDPLTGCFNRRALFDHANRIWAHGLRQKESLGCIMVDVDHFKLVNDMHGHAVGDDVLRDVGKLLRDVVRTSDVVGRYGGEEFCIIAPATDLHQTALLAERIRKAIESTTCGGLSITVSLGVAERTPSITGFDQQIIVADACLYAAKRAGRNRVVFDPPTDISKAA